MYKFLAGGDGIVVNEKSIVHSISGRCVVLRGDDIDTDQIMPSRFLRTVSFQGLGANVFADVRLEAKTGGKLHSFDDPQFSGSTLLVVNRNFGCGSSREHAPQGLYRWGIRAIIGESFGEIFAGNCVSLGIPCVTASQTTVSEIQSLIESGPSLEALLSLESLTLLIRDHPYHIVLNEGRRLLFVEGGWDPLTVLLSAEDLIEARMHKLGYLTSIDTQRR